MLQGPIADAGSAMPDPQTGHTIPTLAPRGVERLHRLRGDLRMGLPVILTDGPASVMIALVETLTEDRYRAMTELGQADLILTRRRAGALGAGIPVQGDTLRLRVPAGADMGWLAAVAGQAGPDAVIGGAGLPILQAATALHRAAIDIAKSAQMVPAILAVPLAGQDRGALAALDLSVMTLAAVTAALAQGRSPAPVSSARLPTAAAGAGQVHVFRPDDGGAEHYAIAIGAPDPAQPVTVRLHSACFTGDVLGSLRCDCGPQLRAAMAAMADTGGVLLYLNQEGRGIGLANKMRAYALQDAGLDTVDANHWLGFEDDQRDFRIGAQILRSLGHSRVRLMTNNPAKVASLTAQGIDVVERVPLRVGRTAQNAQYLATKAARSGHLL